MTTAADHQAPVRLLVIGPPTIHTDRWCAYFHEKGFDVRRLDYGGTRPGALRETPAASRIRVAGILIRQVLAVRRQIRAVQPDLVQAHWLSGPGWFAALAGARPLVVTAWGSDALLDAGRDRPGRALTRIAGRRAHAVTYDASAVRDALARLGVPEAKLHRVVFGADARAFSPGARNTALLERLGITPEAFVVVSPRGIKPVYRPETVLRGFAHAQLGPDGYLLVRAREDDPLWPPLAALAASLGITKRVRTYAGVEQEDLPDLLRSCDAIVSVPSSDGTSVTLLEALFTELPVVVSDLPANREWVPSDAYGQIVPVGSASALGDALSWIRSHRDDSQTAASLAAKRARELGDAERQFASVRDLYLQLVGR